MVNPKNETIGAAASIFSLKFFVNKRDQVTMYPSKDLEVHNPHEQEEITLSELWCIFRVILLSSSISTSLCNAPFKKVVETNTILGDRTKSAQKYSHNK